MEALMADYTLGIVVSLNSEWLSTYIACKTVKMGGSWLLLTGLSITQPIQRRMINEVIGKSVEGSSSGLTRSMWVLRKNTRTLIQDIRSPNRSFNWNLTDYEVGLVSSWPRCSANLTLNYKSTHIKVIAQRSRELNHLREILGAIWL
jgi:hypothetical protein